MLFPTGRSVVIMGLGDLDEAVACEGGRSFRVLYLVSLNVSRRRVR
jgi:hypothetical protein